MARILSYASTVLDLNIWGLGPLSLRVPCKALDKAKLLCQGYYLSEAKLRPFAAQFVEVGRERLHFDQNKVKR